MAKCKICGKDVIVGEVIHSACRESRTYKVLSTVCDKYCKYPDICSATDELEKHCDVCKVAHLLGCK